MNFYIIYNVDYGYLKEDESFFLFHFIWLLFKQNVFV